MEAGEKVEGAEAEIKLKEIDEAEEAAEEAAKERSRAKEEATKAAEEAEAAEKKKKAEEAAAREEAAKAAEEARIAKEARAASSGAEAEVKASVVHVEAVASVSDAAEAREAAAIKEAADKAAADKTAAEKAVAKTIEAEKVAAEKAAEEKASAEKAAEDNAAMVLADAKDKRQRELASLRSDHREQEAKALAQIKLKDEVRGSELTLLSACLLPAPGAYRVADSTPHRSLASFCRPQDGRLPLHIAAMQRGSLSLTEVTDLLKAYPEGITEKDKVCVATTFALALRSLSSIRRAATTPARHSPLARASTIVVSPCREGSYPLIWPWTTEVRFLSSKYCNRVLSLGAMAARASNSPIVRW